MDIGRLDDLDQAQRDYADLFLVSDHDSEEGST